MLLRRILSSLGSTKEPRNLSREEASRAFASILSGAESSSLIASFFVTLRWKGVTTEELLGMAMAARAVSRVPCAGMSGLVTVAPPQDGHDMLPPLEVAAGLIAAAAGARVLDVCSHVGGVGLAALAGGAAAALCVDGSAPALDLATQGAAAMDMSARFDTRQGDAFDVLTALGEEGAEFDLVICDPPAFAQAKPALDAGLRAYERVARLSAGLVAPGGILALCSCSHAADLAKFRTACVRGIGRAGRAPALIHTGFAGPDHPLLPQLAESGYLKALFFRL